jgi:hypothetical protein
MKYTKGFIPCSGKIGYVTGFDPCSTAVVRMCASVGIRQDHHQCPSRLEWVRACVRVNWGVPQPIYIYIYIDICTYKTWGFPSQFVLINRGVMATLQERRLGHHSRAGLEPGTSRFSTLRINHYAARPGDMYERMVKISCGDGLVPVLSPRPDRGLTQAAILSSPATAP